MKSWPLVSLAAACALALGACSKQEETNANAPGSPGTGNSTEVVRPAAPDGPPGGPSGIAGSAPHTGSSGGDVLPGTTGRGTTDATARSQTAEPASGLNGGLSSSGSNAVMGGSPAADTSTTSAPSGNGPGSTAGGSGSSNTTPDSAVGRR